MVCSRQHCLRCLAKWHQLQASEASELGISLACSYTPSANVNTWGNKRRNDVEHHTVEYMSRLQSNAAIHVACLHMIKTYHST